MQKPNGSAYTLGELPLLLQAILLIEAAAYDLLDSSSVPEHKRHDVAGHLRAVADILESDDPLSLRRRHDS